MPRQIALLRGINLASKRRVAMGDLRELLEGAGYDDVRTHLQSGNVVLSSSLSPRRLETALERQLKKRFGFEVRVLVRTRAELEKVVERDPLGDVATNGSRYLVSFLSKRLPTKIARGLESADIAPEQVVVSGRRDLRVAPNRRAALETRQASGRRKARRHRDHAQLEHRPEAARARGQVTPRGRFNAWLASCARSACGPASAPCAWSSS